MRPVRAAVGAAVAIAVLGGCSRGETANETLPEAAPSPTETSDALPPLGPPDLPMPPEAREQTAAGTGAFIRYYMEVYNAAQASMDPTYLDQFSQDCETCDRLIANIREDAEAGYEYGGGDVTVTSMSDPAASGPKAEIAFSMTQAQLTVRDSSGAEIEPLSAPRSELRCGAIAMWSSADSTWILAQWDVN